MPGWQTFLGDHDPPGVTREQRDDQAPLDGDGSPYWLLTVALPGFGAFRYPGKLLTLTSLALTALAGMGCDKLLAGRSVRAERWTLGIFALTLVCLSEVTLGREQLVAGFETDVPDLLTSPQQGRFDAAGTVRNLQHALVHGAIAWGVLAALVHFAWRRPRLAAPAAIVFLTLDLAIANRALIFTLPQAAFDQKPRLLELIEQAERAQPGQGPFRVHRPTGWSPTRLTPQSNSQEAERLSFDWAWSTITPKVALPYGLEYAFTTGTTELAEYSWFFFPFTTQLDAGLAERLDVEPNHPVVYYPRRGFDLWNTRYFILPSGLRWYDPARGFASLLVRTSQIAPDPTAFSGPEGKKLKEDWSWREDWSLLRNEQAFPRAWVVHRARWIERRGGRRTAELRERIQRILYAGDPFWHVPGRPVDDPHEVAWVEVDDLQRLRRFIAGGQPTPSETAVTRYPNPQRVEIEARLDKPGLVILADVFYPGWKLQIDGREAPLLRVNGMMRGAAVEAGFHRLVYKYEPASFQAGVAVTGITLAVALAVSFWVWRNPAGPGLESAMSALAATAAPDSSRPQ